MEHSPATGERRHVRSLFISDLRRQTTEHAHWGLGKIVSRKATSIGWTTHGHTGGDVPLFAYGPGRPVGLIDGPWIGALTAEALGLNLRALNARLSVDARQALPGAKIDVPEVSPKNVVVKIALGNRTAEWPVNKNLLMLDGQCGELEGVVVCAPPLAPKTGPRVYLPQQAVLRILGRSDPLPPIQTRARHRRLWKLRSLPGRSRSPPFRRNTRGNGYITKPFSRNGLSARVRAVVRDMRRGHGREHCRMRQYVLPAPPDGPRTSCGAWPSNASQMHGGCLRHGRGGVRGTLPVCVRRRRARGSSPARVRRPPAAIGPESGAVFDSRVAPCYLDVSSVGGPRGACISTG